MLTGAGGDDEEEDLGKAESSREIIETTWLKTSGVRKGVG